MTCSALAPCRVDLCCCRQHARCLLLFPPLSLLLPVSPRPALVAQFVVAMHLQITMRIRLVQTYMTWRRYCQQSQATAVKFECLDETIYGYKVHRVAAVYTYQAFADFCRSCDSVHSWKLDEITCEVHDPCIALEFICLKISGTFTMDRAHLNHHTQLSSTKP